MRERHVQLCFSLLVSVQVIEQDDGAVEAHFLWFLYAAIKGFLVGLEGSFW